MVYEVLCRFKRICRNSRTVFLGVIISVIMLPACRGNELYRIATPTTRPSPTPEPIVPTRTPAAVVMATLTPTKVPELTPSPSPSATSSPTPMAETENEITPESIDVSRFGITGGLATGVDAYESGLPFGVLLNWNVSVEVPESSFEYWQMVRTWEEGIRRTTWEEIDLAINANPGSYWLVGNEPDVRWQDNVTPQRYAEIYHEVYTFIKERDPTAKLVIGGVTQPTPLRRAYLDIVLDTYEEAYGEKMPIDIWNVHGFTLREERDSWGVDIPPGMEDDLAIAYEIEDHDNLNILKQNLIEFRSWMAERGYGDKPLIISEYGILMPEDYGFPVERVSKYMTDSFDLFRTLTGENGYQPDDGRLVQKWFWYSVYDGEVYPTGDLFDPSAGQLTDLGEIWAGYVNGAADPRLTQEN